MVPREPQTAEPTTDTSSMLAMLRTSADNLARGIEDLDDERAAAPSALPGWTRGHVLTHLARNADALVNLLTWARTGVETPMYPSRQVRDEEIEAGAGRPAAELRTDVLDSQARFMTAAEQMSEDGWRAAVRWGAEGREGTAEVVPWLRLVEIEIHHVDLGLGYTPAHWTTRFVQHQLARTVEDWRGRDDAPALVLRATDADVEHTIGSGDRQVVVGPQAALLAWLVGRSDGAGLALEAGGASRDSLGGFLPELPAWR
jgi:maleylpyruvate isomerase